MSQMFFNKCDKMIELTSLLCSRDRWCEIHQTVHPIKNSPGFNRGLKDRVACNLNKQVLERSFAFCATGFGRSSDFAVHGLQL